MPWAKHNRLFRAKRDYIPRINYIPKIEYKYIGYVKCDDYIVTIETPHKVNPQDIKIIDSEKATYTCHKFRVKSIEHIATNEEVESINVYKKDKVYNFDQKYNIDKKIVFDLNFVENKNYMAFSDGYTGIIKTYNDCGSLYEEYYHNNGKIEGSYKLYFPNGNLKETRNYINGILCGESTTYNINSDILYTLFY
jgi:antitoxin component YwqK of YwqJK toxin-antitoxin module